MVEAQKGYFGEMSPEALDECVTGYLLDAGFLPETLEMSNLAPEYVTAYVPSSPMPEGNTEAGMDGAVAGEVDVEGSTAGDAPVHAYTVVATATGDWGNLYRLLNKVSKKRGIELVSYSFYASDALPVPPKANGGDSQDNLGRAIPDRFSLTLKLYVDTGKGSGSLEEEAGTGTRTGEGNG
ncbi:MAG: hypothetical protein LBD12_05900, partial [Clostridiales Family XIII bacterium]|jgi:hypothetical protein|nr:hypothetical protein [Clostridiales Family XIII bacterium]